MHPMIHSGANRTAAVGPVAEGAVGPASGCCPHPGPLPEGEGSRTGGPPSAFPLP